MTSKQKKQIKKIKDETECLFNFKCLKTKFSQHYKILKDLSWEGFIETSERPPTIACGHSRGFGYSYLCFCPLAVYVIKNKIKF